jgi:hypothetical protein
MMTGEAAMQRLVAYATIGSAARSMNEKQTELERAIKEMSWAEFSEFMSVLNDDEKARAMALRKTLIRNEEDNYGKNEG